MACKHAFISLIGKYCTRDNDVAGMTVLPLQVMWWDVRKLTKPMEVLTLNLPTPTFSDEPNWTIWARSHGVSFMDYHPSIPARFMVCIKFYIDMILTAAAESRNSMGRMIQSILKLLEDNLPKI